MGQKQELKGFFSLIQKKGCGQSGEQEHEGLMGLVNKGQWAGYTEAHFTVRYLQLMQLNNNIIHNSNIII